MSSRPPPPPSVCGTTAREPASLLCQAGRQSNENVRICMQLYSSNNTHVDGNNIFPEITRNALLTVIVTLDSCVTENVRHVSFFTASALKNYTSISLTYKRKFCILLMLLHSSVSSMLHRRRSISTNESGRPPSGSAITPGQYLILNLCRDGRR